MGGRSFSNLVVDGGGARVVVLVGCSAVVCRDVGGGMTTRKSASKVYSFLKFLLGKSIAHNQSFHLIHVPNSNL